MITFAYTILYVQDVEKSISFYERAFDLKRKFIVPGNSYGELITGATTLSFASIEQASSNLKDGFIESSVKNKPQAFEIAFATDDVGKVCKRAIQEGAIAESEPAFKSHGQTVAYVRDPDGFLIEICTPMD
ncbi:MAG TPA: VOC family protein [Chryseolinea sp.]|nr:VOC family protein [Chryseolinea sp.]HPH45668.1 VOC family protein [Chryseolinea sp.]HPM29291.1 VOC family protein [Chryseolinea sp.]